MNTQILRNTYLAAGVLIPGLILSACGGGGSGSGATVNNHATETVVYVSGDGDMINGETELYAVDDDGLNLRRLSASTAKNDTDIDQFAVSPDGQWVAYLSDVASGFEINALYVVPIDGSSAPKQASRVLSTGLNRSVKDFQWSPDSTQLVYTANLDGNPSFFANEVFLVNRDGSGEIKINGSIGSPASVEVRNPQWSPNGRYILQEVAIFSGSTARTNPYALNIYDANAGTPNSTRLVNAAGNDNVTIRNVHWSPDSTRFSYTTDLQANKFNVFVTNVSGSSTVQVTDNGDFSSDSRWSPDGSRLAYLDHPSAQMPSDLVVSLATAGAADTVLVSVSPDNRRVTDFEWSPDGQRIAYRANQNADNIFELFVINADGSGPATQVSGTLIASGDAFEFAWSADGNSIAYLADQRSDTVIDLYISSANGLSNTLISDSLSGEEVVDFEWSADGLLLGFSTGPTGRTPSADILYASQPDGSGRLQLNEITSSGPVSFSF